MASHRRADQSGQGLAEYALIVALITVVVAIALILLANQASEAMNDIQTYQAVPAGSSVIWGGERAGLDSRILGSFTNGNYCIVQQDFNRTQHVWVSGTPVCAVAPSR